MASCTDRQAEGVLEGLGHVKMHGNNVRASSMSTKYKDEPSGADRGAFEAIQVPVRPGEADEDQLLRDLLQGGRVYSLRRHDRYLS